jgi:hypothetical protein
VRQALRELAPGASLVLSLLALPFLYLSLLGLDSDPPTCALGWVDELYALGVGILAAAVGVLALGAWAAVRIRYRRSVAAHVAGQVVLLATAGFLALSLGGGYSC